ncbi:hypothetical protein GUITHDRAFT_105964 [Guillardia theta CCMP2712]|uniref:Protein FAM32A n=1 Tax=Guillardia theta (strain CCMP2712) TaxID=905079 RepID=L1JIP8_GUITC|nr:hypothetical protein GUITHDRAFT_105964 [Guillardia theta CCMP2712]EKX48356.1 hypothetical protein GUITHDRAFT_105964 [Guillardia theta CCMP2712]|eukprot:XP_005835336.1 hypothetical protein GUITHDRAFT_105964 [Guillardia theta CCMP2712]
MRGAAGIDSARSRNATMQEKKKLKKDTKAGNEVVETKESKSTKQDLDDDGRTAYERKWDEQLQKLEQRRAKENAKKSHRQRVDEFNERLSKLSEHNDVPRVAGGA